MKKKFMLIVAVLAVLAGIFGLSAVKADAAGTPEQAACFLQSPSLATQWQISSDYFAGIYAPEQQFVAQKYTFSGNRAHSGYNNPIRLKMSLRGVNGHQVTKAMACYETYVWDHLSDADGAPLYYADGSPVLFQRITSASWQTVNPANMLVFSIRGIPQLGQTGYNLAAWAVGGDK